MVHLPPDVPVGVHSKDIQVDSLTELGLRVAGYAELTDCGIGWQCEEVHIERIYWDHTDDAREQFRWWQDQNIGYVVREPDEWLPGESVDPMTAGWLVRNEDTREALLAALQHAAEEDIRAEAKRPF